MDSDKGITHTNYSYTEKHYTLAYHMGIGYLKSDDIGFLQKC